MGWARINLGLLTQPEQDELEQHHPDALLPQHWIDRRHPYISTHPLWVAPAYDVVTGGPVIRDMLINKPILTVRQMAEKDEKRMLLRWQRKHGYLREVK